MTKQLIFEGNLCRLETRVTECETTVDDFIDQLLKDISLSTGLLPPNTIFYSRIAGSLFYTFELPPEVRKIHYRDGDASSETEIQQLSLSFPWTYWRVEILEPAMAIRSVKLCCSPAKINSPEESIYRIPLPNIHPNGIVCTGNLTVSNSGTGCRAKEVVNTILETTWNTDLSPDYSEFGIQSLFDWAEKSCGNPSFYKEISYQLFSPQTFGAYAKGDADG